MQVGSKFLKAEIFLPRKFNQVEMLQSSEQKFKKIFSMEMIV